MTLGDFIQGHVVIRFAFFRKSAVGGECTDSDTGLGREGCEDYLQGAKGLDESCNGEKKANSRDSNETVILWKYMPYSSVAGHQVKNVG